MSKSKTDKESKKPAASDKDAKPADGGWRETVESVAMAVILALLFRGFVAEAFVIPTGSMAPTLQGRHKDVKCPKCGMWYQVSGSEEQYEDRPTGKHVYSTTCPICRFTHTLDPLHKPNEGSFSGDRIIVGKFCYDLAEPERWDVIVFKFPNNAVQNYIKRLIGLPGETVRVAGGNIYVRGAQDAAEHIARKPPHKLDALLQLVDDTDHIPQELIEIGWPSRWQPWPASEEKAAWENLAGGRAFVCQGDQPEEAWLRYRNLAPSHADWEAIDLNHQLPSDVGQRLGRLITDFYAYNTQRYTRSDVKKSWPLPTSYDPPTQIEQHPGPGDPPPAETLGQHWVDDLAVECLADVTGKQGELSLLLVRGGVKHVCRINLADGKATLSMTNPDGTSQEFLGDDGKTAANPTAKTSVVGPGRYRLRLANCDHEMVLWVNGSVVNFDGPTTYKSADLIAPAYSAADPGDLAPAGIGSKGAAVKVSRLRVYRDKYYIAVDGGSENNDYIRSPRIPGETGSDAEQIQRIFADPTLWESTKFFEPENRRWVDFKLEQDQFLPMGDNSPQSSDGRFWIDHHYVERDLLIGKALLIYWPHTWNRPVPFTPNFSKMGPIR
jgi:signal peptidase I